MPTISNMQENEKLFLAGCLKSIIMADGRFENEELSDLDSILEVYNFPDYGKYLEKLETEIKDEEAFWKLAGSIRNESVRNQILTILQELSVQEGYLDKSAGIFIDRLKAAWNLND
ncbi:MAG: hypothetical protein JW874_03385 [Spirochaetales bacterium]|nr:hypothetical protein [Spirochaetales bacterium]